MSPANDDRSRARRLQQAFLEEERGGVRRSMLLRVVTMPIIAVWIAIENNFPDLLFFEASLALFLLIGLAQYRLSQTGHYRTWHRYLFPALDVLVLALVNFVPNPLRDQQFAPQILLRFGNEIYAFLIIAAAAFTYRPRIVLWTGCFSAFVWLAASGYAFQLEDTVPRLSEASVRRMSTVDLERALMDPRRVDVGKAIRQAIVFVLASGAVAAFVHRSRQLVARQSEAERQRSNLSRYFSANMVDELAQSDEALRASREQKVAVLFVDVVGFTTISEGLSAEQLIGLLREFHARVQRCVFEQRGTLDKYLGDGLMATFGTPAVSEHDATKALACATSIVAAIDEWNGERPRGDELGIRVSVGAHYGPVVLGDIGGEQRLEFAVLGDTVNVASRVESLTREEHTSCLVTENLIARAREEGAPAELLARFEFARGGRVRGRSQEVRLWALRTTAKPAA